MLRGCGAVPQNVKQNCHMNYNSTPRYIPKRNEDRFTQKTDIQMFIAALVIIAQKGKQYKYSSNDKWINKTWYGHTMEYYLAI